MHMYRKIKEKKRQNRKIVYLLGLIFLLTGCAPGPPLPPPPLIFPGFGWLIIGLIIFLFIFLWKKYESDKPIKTDYLTEAINAINQQLKELEKKIDELAKKQDQGKDK